MLRYEKVEQQKQGLKKAAELERRFAKKDGAAAPDGAAADGAAASSDSDSDQDDEDKITETEEAGKQADSCTAFIALLAAPLSFTYSGLWNSIGLFALCISIFCCIAFVNIAQGCQIATRG